MEKAMTSKYLKVVSAFAIDGEICRRGEIVEVSEREAKDLLGRGKAVVATDADLAGIVEQSADEGAPVLEQPAEAEAEEQPAEPQGKSEKAKGK